MSVNHYNLYLRKCFELAETVAIKSEATAEKINEHMLLVHGPSSYNPNDKRTWKYYLNLSGQYHSTDTVLKVVSLDTLAEIDFTTSNLQIHQATRKAYEYGSRYYQDLLFRYPQSEDIILGVLYPVDIDKAINADDFSVLGYPEHLVEENEYSLIEKINEFTTGFKARWYNTQFNISDDWYTASSLGVLYSQLPSLILMLRMRACHTPEAHSFHVRQYLASHGYLDQYLEHLTHKQAMFFYRNIRYIERNAGKVDTFNWLVGKVLTDRNIPLSEYNMQHDASVLPTKLESAVEYKQKSINGLLNSNIDIAVNTRGILNKEKPLAPLNAEYSREKEKDIETLAKRSLSAKLSTKVLESSIVDHTDSMPITIADVFISQWTHYSHTGRLSKVYIRVISPKTGKELVMSVADAYTYWMYAFAKTTGVTLKEIPKVFAARVVNETSIDADTLLAITTKDTIPKSYADFILSIHENNFNVSTLQDFRSAVGKMYDNVVKQLYFVYNQEAITKRSQVLAMVHRLYEDRWYNSNYPGISYKDWIKSKSLELDMTAAQWDQVYKDIFSAVTGIDLANNQNVAQLQKAMISIMQQLGSYSVQYIAEANSDMIKTGHWNSVRVQLDKGSAKTYQEILLGIFRIFKSRVIPKDYKWIELDHLFRGYWFKAKQSKPTFIEVPIGIGGKGIKLNTLPIDLGIFRLNKENLPLARNEDDWINHPNFKAFKKMTQSDIEKIKTVYCDCFIPEKSPDSIDIEDIINSRLIPGFEYIKPKVNYLNLFTYYWLPNRFKYRNQFKDRVYEIPAFEAFWGDDWLNHFKLFSSTDKLSSFKFDKDQSSSSLTSFKFMGGTEESSHFRAFKKGDRAYEMPEMSVVFRESSIDTGFRLDTSSQTLARFMYKPGEHYLKFDIGSSFEILAPFTLNIGSHTQALRFNIRNNEYTVNIRLSAQDVTDLSFRYLPIDKADIATIDLAATKSYEGIVYSLSYKDYSLDSYRLASQYELDFRQYYNSYELSSVDIDPSGLVQWN